jgi:membrane protein DedA with SNARE-associated domain
VFEAIVVWLSDTIFRLGYPGITLLMAIESSFFPFPSEVVLPPAGYLAAQGRMSAPLALGAGLLGSLIGATFNYYLAVALGRPLLHRYHRYLLIRETSLDRAEAFFRRHGEISTFVGRLIPVIRQLISLPAGLARMRLGRFVLYTALGAGIWCAILTFIGWYVGRHAEMVTGLDELVSNPEVQRYSTWAVLALLPVIAVIVGVYAYRHRRPAGSGGPQASSAGQGEAPP